MDTNRRTFLNQTALAGFLICITAIGGRALLADGDNGQKSDTQSKEITCKCECKCEGAATTETHTGGSEPTPVVGDRTGIALTIGLNRVDPGEYSGWSGILNACIADAQDIATLAKEAGFKADNITTLTDGEATRQAVKDAIGAAADRLREGDIFLLHYSGHGGQTPDRNGDESDGSDETWCLFDGQLIDDELYQLWDDFKPGVRIVMLSDSCHSGTVSRAEEYVARINSGIARELNPKLPDHVKGFNQRGIIGGAREAQKQESFLKLMPKDKQDQVYLEHRDLYDEIQQKYTPVREADIRASVLLISGCQDTQYSSDGAENGLFTGRLLQVWRNATFRGNYHTFYDHLINIMPSEQIPNYYFIGRPNPAFENQRPFSI